MPRTAHFLFAPQQDGPEFGTDLGADLGPDLGAGATGLALGTPVLTLDGELPVEYLTPGDRIVTRQGTRVLRRIGVSLAETPMFRLSDGGAAGQPGGETIVAKGTRVLLRDWRAQVVYGKDEVLVAVERIADGDSVAEIAPRPTRLFSLGFDDAVVLYSGSSEIACPTLPA